MLDKLDENKSSSEHKQRMMSGKVEGSRIWKTLYKPMSQMRIAMSMTSSKTREDIIFYHTFSFFGLKVAPYSPSSILAYRDGSHNLSYICKISNEVKRCKISKMQGDLIPLCRCHCNSYLYSALLFLCSIMHRFGAKNMMLDSSYEEQCS